MADKEIVSLPESGAVTDDTLFVVYQPGAAEPAQKLTAEQLGEYARKKVDIPDVTAESIQEALGYTPANEEDVATINANLVGKKGAAEGAEIFNDYAGNEAAGSYAHAEGWSTKANGNEGAHAEGRYTIASGNEGCHAEGSFCQASGSVGAHAEGHNCVAAGSYGCHAEGQSAKAYGDRGCHAEGDHTIAQGASQHVQGTYNIQDEAGKFAHIVGNGAPAGLYSNAHTLDWDGNAWFAGDVYVGSTSGTNMDEGSKKLATVAEVGEMIGQIPGGDVTAESIKTALGYTPADAEDVRQLSEEKVVKYSEQTLTEEQKAQARKNIGVDEIRPGVEFGTDETLIMENGVLRVNTADEVSDSTLPITAAAVNVTVGNIEALLETI